MVNAIIAAADQLLERNEDPSKVSFEGVARRAGRAALSLRSSIVVGQRPPMPRAAYRLPSHTQEKRVPSACMQRGPSQLPHDVGHRESLELVQASPQKYIGSPY